MPEILKTIHSRQLQKVHGRCILEKEKDWKPFCIRINVPFNSIFHEFNEVMSEEQCMSWKSIMWGFWLGLGMKNGFL